MSYEAPTTNHPAAPVMPAPSAIPGPSVTSGSTGSMPPATGSNVLAVVALISAFLVPLAGIVCGHIALVQIRRDGRPGRPLAIAALIIGYAFTAIGVIVMALSLMITLTVGS
ncbi:MAG: DUF4190 domain-containing protein [Actinobacteria bacterium]|nr:DUF4190 domain-containing protein [Actinomycetota bacterium]